MGQAIALIAELRAVCQQPQNLSHQFADLYQQFDGNDYIEQSQLATRLEDEVLAITHETPSVLGCQINDLETLITLLNFRKTFHQFRHLDLVQIIDKPNLSVIEKMQILKHGGFQDKEDFLSMLECIKKTWHANFNKSYQQISEKFVQ